MGQLWWKRNAIGLLGAASVWLATGCAADLGTCDMSMLGGSGGGTLDGQSVVQTHCSGGLCHSATATGKTRVGAPAGLNFDVVLTDSTAETMNRVTAGINKVRDKKNTIWNQVEGDTMPPKGEGGPLVATDKEKLRNWLACGAPMATGTAGTPMVDGGMPSAADWNSIYAGIKDTCTACHSPTAASAVGMGFSFGLNACDAYKAVVNQKSVTGMCKASGLTLVVPGQPSMSFMLQKVKGTQTCGGSMPYMSPMPFVSTNPDVVAKLEAWITAGALKPADCP